MTDRKLSKAMRRVLPAATEGRISRGEHSATRLEFPPESDSPRDRMRRARCVNQSVEVLIRDGYARESVELVDRRWRLVVTADGYQQLSKAGHGR